MRLPYPARPDVEEGPWATSVRWIAQIVKSAFCATLPRQHFAHSLDQFGCLCSTMFRVSPNHLLWGLEGLVAGDVHNRIAVPDDQKHWTRVALDRMLSIS